MHTTMNAGDNIWDHPFKEETERKDGYNKKDNLEAGDEFRKMK